MSRGNKKRAPLRVLFLELIAVAEGEEDRCAAEIVSFAEATFEIAFIAPVKKAKLAAINNKPRWASVSLDHIAEFWMGVFEASWWMASNGVL